MQGCRIIDIRRFDEEKGSLCVIEAEKDIPIKIRRMFYIFGVSPSEKRGRHANRNSVFMMFAINGSCTVKIDNGLECEEFRLDKPNQGLLMNKMTWKEMYDFSEDCTLMVLSDMTYDKEEYIYDYSEFVKGIQAETKEKEPAL